ncbi:hypothetical protein C8T65DRAFT_664158 [Cerioporus squamosus]|nr:hypothetical protein C8T65DRAFT_664158 [Cerioporus squamosus]
MRTTLELLKEPFLARTGTRAKVHPESALMSLAGGGWRCDAIEDEATKTYLRDVFAAGIARDNTFVIMDAGKRCCYCCALLAQLLRPRAQNETGEDTQFSKERPLRPLKFILEPDGTHGVVVLWLPPDGISLDVLREIRARLLGVLRHDMAARTAQEVP